MTDAADEAPDEDAWVEDLPPLVRESALGDLEAVQNLSRAGILPDQADTYGWSALHAAAARGHIEVVSELLAAGAAVDVVDETGMTPLINAAGPGMATVITRLLDAGASVGIRDHAGVAALHRAAQWDDAETVRILIAAGADPGVVDEKGWTPGDYARDAESLSALEALSERMSRHGHDERSVIWAARSSETPRSPAAGRSTG